MKTLLIALIAASLASGSVEAGSMKRIKKEADFKAMIVDKKLSIPAGIITIKSNGKVTGKIPQGRLKGVWNWQKGYWCRNVKVGKNDLGFDCQLVKSDGSTVVFIRDKGKGKASSWTIE